ncbi:MAG: NAD(P)/FAD-dependent oxidoreductase [Actinomycetota bacterium]|nr:NAD(P)/FAD-dependent oxidoreductase [Actinomycetota bacterium]
MPPLPPQERLAPDCAEVDAVVVGGGPAGLAAALWLARYRRSVVVADSQAYRSGMVEHSHGYLGRDPQRPTELIERGRAELLAYPTAAYRAARVTAVQRRGDGRFTLSLDDGGEVIGHRLVLATGVSDAKPEIEGFDEHYGASAFHCPACDGYESRDADVVALGWEPHLVGFATTLLGWARSVTVVTNGRRFTGDETCRTLLAKHTVDLVEEDAVALVGERGALRGVRLQSGRELPCSLLFFSVAHTPHVELATSLGCALDDDGYVRVDGQGQTTVTGVYAAGDLVPGLQLVQVATAQGTIAGVGAAQSMFGEDGAPTSPPPAPDVAAELPGA